MGHARNAPHLIPPLLLCATAPALAQGGAGEEGPSTADLVVLFSVAILFVAGVVIYMTRDIIARKRTKYDEGDFESQRDRDYEKYHSDWGDESAADDGRRERGEFEGRPGGAGLPDYYRILGIGRDATKEAIKRRYRMLAKETHPDRSRGGSSERMAEINKAYEVLSDDERRERYDGLLGPA